MLLLPFVNGDLLSKSDVFQHDRVLAFLLIVMSAVAPTKDNLAIDWSRWPMAK